MAQTIKINKKFVADNHEARETNKRQMSIRHGVNDTTLNRVLNNQRGHISWEMLAVLYTEFGCDLPPFFEFVEER